MISSALYGLVHRVKTTVHPDSFLHHSYYIEYGESNSSASICTLRNEVFMCSATFRSLRVGSTNEMT
jgi:hypothetical protein